MRYLKKKVHLALIAIFGIAVTCFCIEYLSYLYNSGNWPELRKDDNIILKVLLVADPQIQGEQKEHYLYGWLARWDADRYLQKNYNLAKHHVGPQVVAFLGDLFDEGSTANDPEYRRYLKRFRTIFGLPTPQNPVSDIKYIFVAGDNDVGGEREEPVNPVKVNWFRKTFTGDLRSVLNYANAGVDVQFVGMNLFMPEEYNNPLKGMEDLINGTKKPNVRIIISHVSLLSYLTNSVEQVLEKLQPDLIISAHSHTSSYLRYVPGSVKKSVHIIHDLLLPSMSQVTTTDTLKAYPETEVSHTKPFIKVNLKSSENGIHEIIVPTCSYRMGVGNMGYGALQLYRNGTIEYTVLWLPSRFKQLFLYAFIYVLVKIILTPWLFWKIGTVVYRKIKEHRVIERANEYIRLV